MTRAHHHHRSPRAFTLVETLITLSLIGALVGVLLPALGSARDAARQTVCASNIRQLQWANDLYANDHTDRWLPGAVGIAATNLQRWHGARETTGAPFDAQRGPITPYLGDRATSVRARACPTFAPVLDELESTGRGFESGAGGYGYNTAFAGVVRHPGPGGAWVVERDDIGSQRARFARPDSTIAFTDAAFADRRGVDGLIEYSFAEPRFWPDYPGARPNPSIHFRHADSANVAWLDGHVSTERRSFTWAGFGFGVDSGAVGLGWFGAADDNALFDYD